MRSLEREIGGVFRHAALRIAEGSAEKLSIDAGDLPAILGPHKFEAEVAMHTDIPGVATGLAWTPVGGDILFIEVTRMPTSRISRRITSRRTTSTSTCRPARSRKTGRPPASP